MLAVLRDDLGLSGSKEGCNNGNCGACNVLIDGQLVNSCCVLAAEVNGTEILTIEGVASGAGGVGRHLWPIGSDAPPAIAGTMKTSASPAAGALRSVASLPTSLDVPMIDTIMVEVPNPLHPYGVRGVGEPPIVPPLAAIANALYRATGVRQRQLPMSPRRILETTLGLE